MTKRTASQSGKLASQRGKSFEQDMCRQLFDELGIHFKRNLEQTRTAGLGDLIADDADFPFMVECKRRRAGVGIPQGAWSQAVIASDIEAGVHPCVIYRYDHRKPRVVVSFSAIVESETGKRTDNQTDKADISLPRFCKMVREIMAWRAEDERGNQQDAALSQAQSDNTENRPNKATATIDLRSASGKLRSAVRDA